MILKRSAQMSESEPMNVIRILLLTSVFFALPCATMAQSNASEAEINAIINSLAPTVQAPVIAEQSYGSLPTSEESASEAILMSPPVGRTPLQNPGSSPVIVVQTPLELMSRGEVVLIDASRAIDMEVFFEYDSAVLTTQAQMDLRSLGMALISPRLRDFSYLIAGHTDARGDASYNLDLSERRARAVRDFLLREYAIDPSRLIAMGFGEERPRSPDAPQAAINRRVEVALIVTDYASTK